VDPFDEVEWEVRSAVIGNEKGKVVFEQRDVEIPKFWSQQATNIVVSKYFRGQIGTPERERLARLAPMSGDVKTFLSNSGTEAVEAALGRDQWPAAAGMRSIQPVALTRPDSPTYTWDYNEFVDTVDIPPGAKKRDKRGGGAKAAMPTSLIPAMRNTTPSRTPTVAIEVEFRRRTIQAISSHRIPETRNSHQ
jgi:hypothetical protein